MALLKADWFRQVDASRFSSAELRAQARSSLDELSVLLFVNASLPPDPFPFLDDLVSAFGRRYGYAESGDAVSAAPFWMDVRFEPDGPYTFRYSKTGQPLHNDGAYLNPAPDFTLFYVAKQAESGGDSLFVDVETIAECSATHEPQLYQDLTSVPVRFDAPSGVGRTTAILHRVNGRLEIAWNYYRVSPGQDPAVYDLRERFRAFLERLIAEDRVFTHRLNEGDILIFDDRTLLHGRSAFAGTRSGDRLMWKTFFARAYDAAAVGD